jgi:CheY-like chemotaxis protein
VSSQNLKQILLIEDDKDISDVLKDLLESEGYRVTTAENGKEGLDLLAGSSYLPDLILVDLMMPIMNGFEFCKTKNEQEKLKSIPTIVMSADGHMDKKRDQLDVQEYLKKPLDLDIVLNTIAHYAQVNKQ